MSSRDVRSARTIATIAAVALLALVALMVLRRVGGAPSEVVPTSQIAAPALAPPTPRTVTVPAGIPRADLPWRFFRGVPVAGVRSLGDVGASSRAELPLVGDPRAFVATVSGERIVVRREDPAARIAWSATLDTEIAGRPVVMATWGQPPERAYVAAPARAGGVFLASLDQPNGAIQFRLTLPGTTAYEVQLGTTGEGGSEVALYVRLASGGAVEVRDGTTGALRARSELGANDVGLESDGPFAYVKGLTMAGTRWPAKSGGFYETVRTRTHYESISIGGDRLGKERAWALRRVSAEGDLLWSTAVTSSPFEEAAALLEAGGGIVAAVFCESASGVSVVSLDAATGAVRWRVNPFGIGSIGHSKYGNDVSIALEGEGRLRVRGDESGGRYVALVDLATGREISDEVWRR
jgi:hypothetical protein